MLVSFIVRDRPIYRSIFGLYQYIGSAKKTNFISPNRC